MSKCACAIENSQSRQRCDQVTYTHTNARVRERWLNFFSIITLTRNRLSSVVDVGDDNNNNADNDNAEPMLQFDDFWSFKLKHYAIAGYVIRCCLLLLLLLGPIFHFIHSLPLQWYGIFMIGIFIVAGTIEQIADFFLLYLTTRYILSDFHSTLKLDCAQYWM